MFLEFVDSNSRLTSTLADIIQEMGKHVDDLPNRDKAECRVLYVSAEAAAEFLDFVAVRRNHTTDGTYTVGDEEIDIDGNDLLKFTMEPEKIRRKTKITKDHLTSGDINAYSRALQELRKVQVLLLQLEAFSTKTLYEYHAYDMMIKKLKREDKEIKHLRIYDKGANGLESLPNEEQVKDLLNLWWRQGKEGPIQAHESLLNIASFLEMLSGAIRSDVEFNMHYSDKFHLRVDKYITHTLVETPTPLGLFVVQSNEGKCNPNNQKEYHTKLVNKDVLKCAVFAEACLLVCRHDLCGIQIPNYSMFKVRAGTNEITREWYACRWMCSMASKSRAKNNNGILSTYVRKDMFYRRWEAGFRKIGIRAAHVMHLPRLLRTFYGSMIEFSREDNAIIGKWRDVLDNQSYSYDKVPSATLLSRIAGCSDASSYMVPWRQLSPPNSLVQMVLTEFHKALSDAEKRIALALHCVDEIEAQGLNDTACVSSLKYIQQLAIVFVQGVPILRQLHPDHSIFVHHPLFSMDTYKTWEHIQLKHLESIELVGTNVSSTFGIGEYQVLEHDNDLVVSAMDIDHVQTCHSKHAAYLTNEAFKVTKSMDGNACLLRPNTIESDKGDNRGRLDIQVSSMVDCSDAQKYVQGVVDTSALWDRVKAIEEVLLQHRQEIF
eukprot:g9148.t1